MPQRGHTAIQGPDGRWSILDVPIFACGRARNKYGDEFEFTPAWIGEALDWHSWKWDEDDYLEPLIENHTSDGRGFRSLGKFLPRRVGTHRVDRKNKRCVFADLLELSEDDYARVKSGELAYVSVECNDPTWARFSACALMPDKSPHHKFGRIRIEEERHSRHAVTPGLGVRPGVRNRTKAAPVQFAASAPEGVRLRLAASGDDPLERVPMTTATERKIKSAKFDGSKVRFVFEDGEEGEAEAGLDVAAICKAIESGSISIADFAEIKGAMASAEGGVEADEDATPDTPQDAPPEPDQKELMTMSESDKRAVEFSERLGRVEAENKRLRETAKRESVFAKARADLEGYQFNESDLDDWYGIGGEKAVELGVKERRANGRRAPTASGAPAPVVPHELPSDFQFSDDPRVQEREVKYSRMYDEASPYTKSKRSRAEFIGLNMRD